MAEVNGHQTERKKSTMKKVLVLGAGLVTRPHVRYLLDVPDFR